MSGSILKPNWSYFIIFSYPGNIRLSWGNTLIFITDLYKRDWFYYYWNIDDFNIPCPVKIKGILVEEGVTWVKIILAFVIPNPVFF